MESFMDDEVEWDSLSEERVSPLIFSSDGEEATGLQKFRLSSVPEGHLEEGETDLEAAYRETQEEAGLLKDQLRLIDSHIPLKYTANGKPKVVTYWIAELVDQDADVLISHEHQDYSWADYDGARELVSYKDAQTLLDKCHNLIQEEIQRNAK